jgi:hypothetical protein
VCGALQVDIFSLGVLLWELFSHTLTSIEVARSSPMAPFGELSAHSVSARPSSAACNFCCAASLCLSGATWVGRREVGPGASCHFSRRGSRALSSQLIGRMADDARQDCSQFRWTDLEYQWPCLAGLQPRARQCLVAWAVMLREQPGSG